MTQVTLTDPINGTVTDANLIANNNHSIKAAVNGGLADDNVKAAAGIQASKLANYPNDGTKTLLGDGSWGTPPLGTLPARIQDIAVLSTDLNTALASGWYKIDPTTANRPFNDTGICQSYEADANTIRQVAYATGSDEIWFRRRSSGSWFAWVKQYPQPAPAIPDRIDAYGHVATNLNTTIQNGWYAWTTTSTGSPNPGYFGVMEVVADGGTPTAVVTQVCYESQTSYSRAWKRTGSYDGVTVTWGSWYGIFPMDVLGGGVPGGGATGQVLTKSGPGSYAVGWMNPTGGGGNVATDPIFDVKGDLPVGTGADTAVRVPVGSNGQVLTADSSLTAGVKWATPTVSGTTSELDYAQIITDTAAISATTEATSVIFITGNPVTYDGSTKVKVELVLQAQGSANTGGTTFVVYRDSTPIGWISRFLAAASSVTVSVYGAVFDTPSAGSHTYKVACFVAAGSATVKAGPGGTGNSVPAYLRVTRDPNIGPQGPQGIQGLPGTGIAILANLPAVTVGGAGYVANTLTNILNQGVAGGTLGTNKIMRVTLAGDRLQNSSATTARFVISWGGSAILDYTSGSLATNAIRVPWRLEFDIAAVTDVTHQAMNGLLSLFANATATAVGIIGGGASPVIVPIASNGPVVVDSTVSQTLNVQAALNVSNAAIDLRMHYGQIQVVG